jgi:ADP-ribosylation factor GTPase-activating protein 2/3
LGAQKTKAVDFAAAERKAREEEERIRQLGYDREREEAEEKTRKEAEAKRKTTEIGKLASASSSPSPTTKSTPPAFARLGFGALPGAGTAVAAAPAATPTKVSTGGADDSPTVARDRFGGQKAISSDMYFERNAYDPAATSEAQTRLQSFQGATSISSNQYFGREEDEETMPREGGVLGDGSLAGLENAARDAMGRFLANPDVQNVGESIRTGALKLSDYLAQMNMDR